MDSVHSRDTKHVKICVAVMHAFCPSCYAASSIFKQPVNKIAMHTTHSTIMSGLSHFLPFIVATLEQNVFHL